MARSRIVADLADAFIEASLASKAVPEAMDGLAKAVKVFREYPEALQDLSETAVPMDKRRFALKTAFEGEVHDYALNALLSLQEWDRLTELSAFYDLAKDIAAEKGKHFEVDVQSAVPLEAKERKELIETLETKLKGTVRLEERVDPSLLGGIRVSTKGWQMDASVKGKLQRLKQELYV